MRRLSMLLCCAALVAGCQQDSSTPSSPGCVSATAGTCSTGATVTQAACTTQAGTWAAGGCPGEGQVGTCAQSDGTLVVYYAPTWSEFAAQYYCTGTWTPVPPPPPPPPPSGVATVSCDETYICTQITAEFSAETYATLQASCSATFRTAPCEVANAVAGRCQVTSTDPAYLGLTMDVFTYPPVFTASTAVTFCSDLNDPTTTATWIP